MTNLTQNFANPNNQPLVIGEFSIRQDDEGRYCLNDLHKASGDDKKHFPAYFLRNQQTKDLIEEIERYADSHIGQDINSANLQSAVKVIKGGAEKQGTYVVKELVYSYAMWISARFHLMVIRAYDAMVMQWKLNDRQSISPEQQALLHEIVARRSNGERKIFAEMWARHNRHFKIPRYAELLAIHFPEAIHYLETMEIKAKTDKKEVKLIGIKPYEDKNVQLLMWYVPILAKYIKNEIYPALISIQSGYSGQLIGLTQEIVGYANSLNRQALDNGMKHLNHVGSQPVHTIQWYLEG